MLYSGFFAPVRLGEICRQTLGIGKIHSAVSAVGAIVGCGKSYSKSLSINPIMSG